MSNGSFAKMFLALFIARAASFDGQCFLCQTVSSIIIDLINKRVEAAEIPQKVAELCAKKVPSYLRVLCQQIASIPIQELIRILEDQTTPTKACEIIKMCRRVSANKRIRIPKTVKKVAPFVAKQILQRPQIPLPRY
jgi:hypothetical protein